MKWLTMLICLLTVARVSPLLAADVAGSKDHPLMTRYPESEIEWYDEKGYEPYHIATGPVSNYKEIKEWTDIEGRVTRIYYSLKGGGRSLYEVYANYLNAVKKADFEILADGFHKENNTAKDIGGRNWLGVTYAKNAYPSDSPVKLIQGSSTSGGSGFFAAHKKRDNDEIHVAFAIAQYSKDEIVALLDIIEKDVMEDDLVQVNADAMLKSIEAEGKVALYGIFFDVGKAEIKEESHPAIAEIAKLLQAQPDLNLYVVGHTDFTGHLKGNVELSKMRAAAVVVFLKDEHKINGDRLSPQGIGPLAPVASNRSDEGRAKNRRVELVEMK